VRARQVVRSGLERILGPKFFKHYVQPRRVTGETAPYDAKRFFESWHRASGGSLSDAGTIAAGRSAVATRYHYDAVEASIIEYLATRPLPDELSVLDVGSGAGHWIDFYREVFGAATVVGTEISEPTAESLREKYDGVSGVEIVSDDVSSEGFDLGQRFDVVNAIGVMFHIVEDQRWELALGNLARHLAAGGSLLVGGQFGRVTQDVQFHRKNEFETWDEFRTGDELPRLVNKRIRSLRRWREAADRANLRVECVKRTRTNRLIETPENNVLVLSASAVPPDGAGGSPQARG
jgi:SAM-dependent methyltransferase